MVNLMKNIPKQNKSIQHSSQKEDTDQTATNPQEENCVSQTKVTIGQSNRSSSIIPETESESSWRQDENPLMKYLAKDTAQTGIANKDVRQKSVKEGQ